MRINNRIVWIGILAVSLTILGLLIYKTLILLAEREISSGFAFTDSSKVIEISEAKEQKSIVFVGDIMMARDVERRLAYLGGEYVFAGVKDYFANKFVVGNFEASIPQIHEPTPNFAFKFSVPVASLNDLVLAGFTQLSLANNHSFDFGAAGYQNTFKSISDYTIKAFGHPSAINSDSVTYIDNGNKTVAIIGLSNLYTAINKKSWDEIFKEAESKSDIQIVYIHWGEEYELIHSVSQEKLAKELIDSGVDIIVGHHPHVVQGIQKYNNGIIFYSLGNFLFDQYWEESVLTGLALELQENENGWIIDILPVESASVRLQPQFMTGETKSNFLKDLAKRSDISLKNDIEAGQISLQF